MSNFLADIEEAVGTEDIEGIYVYGDSVYCRPEIDIKQGYYEGDTAFELLDYEYYTGYGTEDCHHIEIFTKDHVYYVQEYDGSTWIESVMRNPPNVK